MNTLIIRYSFSQKVPLQVESDFGFCIISWQLQKQMIKWQANICQYCNKRIAAMNQNTIDTKFNIYQKNKIIIESKK